MREPGPRFYVTGLGRSGTKWLAAILNRDPQWTVLHEPYTGIFVDAHPSQHRRLARAAVLGRFAHARYYGEVNSQLRRYVLPWRGQAPLRVGRQAILARDPVEVMRSYMARRPKEQWPRVARALAYDVEVLRKALRTKDFEVFHTRDLVLSPGPQIDRVATWAGLSTGLATDKDREPVNATAGPKPSLLELDRESRKLVGVSARQFRRDFGLR